MKPTGERVLVIDDDQVALELLTATIQAAGFEVIARRVPPQVQEVKRLGVSAVICDLVMETQDGDRVLSSFHNEPELRDVPFILVSADGHRLDYALEKMPWLHCVRKDGALAAVVGTLGKLIERSRAMESTGKFRFGEPATGNHRLPEPPSGKHRFAEPVSSHRQPEPSTGNHRLGEPGTGNHRLGDTGAQRFGAEHTGSHNRPGATNARDRVRQRFFEQVRETTRALRPYLIGGVLGPRAYEEVKKRFAHLRGEAALATVGTVMVEALTMCERLTDLAQRDLRAMELLGGCTVWLAGLDPNQPFPISLDGVPVLCDARTLLAVR
jgi:CheY-like chemotaxis protein